MLVADSAHPQLSQRYRYLALLGLLTVVALASGSGCGILSGYHLRHAVAQHQCGYGMSGAWEGEWVSYESGHHGNLRAIMQHPGTNMVDCEFHARYFKLLTFRYTIPLHVQRHGDVWHFSGSADLGKLAGGVYRCRGYATDTHFVAYYCSQYDRGKFELCRVGCYAPMPDGCCGTESCCETGACSAGCCEIEACCPPTCCEPACGIPACCDPEFCAPGCCQ